MQVITYMLTIVGNSCRCISDKMEHFSYKGGCGDCGYMHIKMVKRRPGLGYK